MCAMKRAQKSEQNQTIAGLFMAHVFYFIEKFVL